MGVCGGVWGCVGVWEVWECVGGCGDVWEGVGVCGIYIGIYWIYLKLLIRFKTNLKVMMKYLSYGGGVNSTALLIYLEEKGEDFETIFVNHGGDWPETYDYIEYLREKGYEIKEIIPKAAGCTTILEYCYHHKMVPGIQRRFCTDHFKLRPIHKYVEKPCEIYIGISFEEKKRVRESKRRGIKNRYPLVDAKITREECKKIIRAKGLEVPSRSGCYFCPFISKADARKLWRMHPDLFQQVVQLEKDCNKPGYYINPKGISFEQFADVQTPDLDSVIDQVCARSNDRKA